MRISDQVDWLCAGHFSALDTAVNSLVCNHEYWCITISLFSLS
uniref:Uncharacterized protein n=1 Tax=Rhizophora mucronata TaxID=61149 RepID=A0A2P2JIH2_RHIMU